MATPKNWTRYKEKEKDDIIRYWKNKQKLVVAIKKYGTMRPDWSNYEVVLLDKKNYGSAPISNRRKTVGTGNNKEKLRKAVSSWMRENPEATRKDFESLARKIRQVK